ncbi:MAG: tripartite tricarboxylate transporter TctB family protein [Chloroflexota bacterium]
MRRVYQIAALLFLAFSVYLMFASRTMEYYVDLGPGPGFFPFWLGALMAVLSIIWLAQASRGPGGPLEPGFIPERRGLIRIGCILLAMALFGWVVDYLGFQLTMLVFLVFLLTALGRQKPIVTATAAIVGSFGVYYAFTQGLDVQLPASSIEFLSNLGL